MESFTQVEADEPQVNALSDDEVIRQLRMNATEAGAAAEYLEDLISAATHVAETFTKRRFIDQHIDWQRDAFGCGVIRLPFANVTEIESITYLDANGDDAELTIATDIRSVLPTGPKCGRGTIEPVYGSAWPATYPVSGAVTIRLKAGYGAQSSQVPAAIRRGMLALIAHWDRNREAVNVGNITSLLPMGVKYCWTPFRTH